MKHLFLYRLLKHSKPAFLFVLFFTSCYAIFFYKKMDMVLFPYNNMYTVDFTGTKTASTYAMKINGRLIKITHQPYWKKDFLESSLNSYCRYTGHDHTVPLADYIHQKYDDGKIRDMLLEDLIPSKKSSADWPKWYAHFAGYSIPANALIELMQYNFRYDGGKSVLIDSVSIAKAFLQ